MEKPPVKKNEQQYFISHPDIQIFWIIQQKKPQTIKQPCPRSKKKIKKNQQIKQLQAFAPIQRYIGSQLGDFYLSFKKSPNHSGQEIQQSGTLCGNLVLPGEDCSDKKSWKEYLAI